MLNKLNKNQSGITIVELMIVIAVAALIIVLVLVAAPALQRNARNAQRRNDIGAIRGQLTTISAAGGFNHIDLRNNLSYPSNTTAAGRQFDMNVLEQVEQSIYKDEDAERRPENKAKNEPLIVYGGFAGAIDSSGNYYNNQAQLNMQISSRAYPGPDELHILSSVRCGSDVLAGGNPVPDEFIASILYNATAGSEDLIYAGDKIIAFIYQLEGETKARCEDNA